MKKLLKALRIVIMSLLCVILLLSVCALPSFLESSPIGSGEESLQSPPQSSESSSESSSVTESTPSKRPRPDPPDEYVTVDGDALDIVDVSKVKYTYSEMVDDLALLFERYPDKMSYSVVGNSLDGRNIYAVMLGNPDADKQILISAGVHGRESLTPMLVMKQLEFYLYNYDTAKYGDTPLYDIFEEYTFCILPMCNPDGITLTQFGISAIRNANLRNNVLSIYESDRSKGYVNDVFSKYITYWKANAAGVDVNRNFNTADWENVLYVKQPSHRNYKGEAPETEPETKALVSFVNSLSNPVLSLAIHSQGEVLYYNSGQDDLESSEKLAEIVGALNGYKLDSEARHDAAFDDWCILNKGIPSVTIETGSYKVTEPIPEDEFKDIWKDNRDLWVHVAVSYMNQD